MNELLKLVPTAFAVLGVMAFVVSVIVEVIKNLKVLKDIYTDIVVTVVSVALSVVAYFAYAEYAALKTTWYMVIGVVIAGLFVAFISMFGWTKFTELLDRYRYDKQGRD